jgi:hypothetical protein
MDGNVLLTSEAQLAFRRIRALQEVSKKTRYVTTHEQMDVLIALSPEDMTQVAEILRKDGQGGAR